MRAIVVGIARNDSVPRDAVLRRHVIEYVLHLGEVAGLGISREDGVVGEEVWMGDLIEHAAGIGDEAGVRVG